MATNSILIQGLIELHLKGEGGDQAVASMTKIIDQAKRVEQATGGIGTGTAKATEGVNSLEKAFGKLGATVAAYFAVGAVKNFLQDSYIGFARTERQLLATENQIRALGGALEGAGFRDFIRNLSHTSGILDDDLVPAFQRALGAFKDYSASAEIVTLASKFAAAGIGDVASNVDAIARFFQTGQARGLVQFGIDIKAGADGTIDLSEGLKALNDQASQVGGNFSDAERGLELFKIAVDETKDSVGELLFGITTAAQSVGKKLLENVPTELLPSGLQSGADLAKFLKDNADAIEQARVDAFFNSESELEAATRIFAAKQAERNKEDNKKKAEEALKAEQERLAKVADLEAKSAQDRLKSEIDATGQGTDERLRLELELNQKLFDEAIKNAKKIGASTIDIEKFFANERSRIIRTQGESNAERDAREAANENFIAAGFDEVEKFVREEQEKATKIAEVETKKREKLAKEEAELKAQLAQRNLQLSLSTSGAAAAALGELFGRYKGFAIATAIINTALGITSVWADNTLPWIAKVAATIQVAASGAAQIQTIRGANAGGGGSPNGGVASAPTSQAAPPQQVGGQSTAQIAALSGRSAAMGSAGTTINIGTAFGDDQSMTRLARKLDRIARNDQSVLR